jgi:hypothetical protein
MNGQVRLTILVVAAILVVASIAESMRPSQAMPNFAQTLGTDCEVCHSVAPALNAYGRYIQRSNYSSLDAATIHRAIPIWLGETAFYDTMDPNLPHKVQFGNFALHGAGFIGTDFTFHFHQWVWQSDQPGGTDTLWLTYNKLFHRDGHLTVGKLEAPAPSFYSQFFDLSGFATPGMTVGEHAYPLANNRWGAKFDYVKSWFTGSLAYLGPSGNLDTATKWGTLDTEKTLQWRAVYARPDRPIEVGLYGGSGVLTISDGTLDRYNSTAGYAQLDSMHNLPGAILIYQHNYDNNPAAGAPATSSHGLTEEIFEPFTIFHTAAVVSARNELTDDGMGTIGHTGNVDFSIIAFRHVSPKFTNALILNAEATLAANSTPGWKAQAWYVFTIGRLH